MIITLISSFLDKAKRGLKAASLPATRVAVQRGAKIRFDLHEMALSDLQAENETEAALQAACSGPEEGRE